MEPKAWKSRYFKAASGSCPQEEEEIKGIKEIMLISKDIQIINQCDEERAIIVLVSKDIINKFI